MSSFDESGLPCPPGGRTDSQGKEICKHQGRLRLARASGEQILPDELDSFFFDQITNLTVKQQMQSVLGRV